MKSSHEYKTPPRRKRALPGRLPLPESVQVYNLLPPVGGGDDPENDSEDHHTSWTTARFMRRPEYSTSLLTRVQLELLVQPTTALPSSASAGHVLYRSVLDHRDGCSTVRPIWRHLNEHIDSSSLSIEEYESMVLRLTCFHNGSSSTGNGDGTVGRSVILEMPIHPSKLVRCASLPDRLPLNLVAVHYTDQSLRIPPAQHQLLLDSKQQPGLVVDRLVMIDDEFTRFQDDVFRTLDQVAPSSLQNSSSLLETDDETQATPISKPIQVAGAPESSFVTEEALYAEDLVAENERLEQLIREEEAALRVDVEILRQDQEELRALREAIATKDQQTREVDEAIQQELTECHKLGFILEPQRIRLVRELRTIYPIVMHTDQRYTIRGLEIPIDLFAGTVSEDEVSAALGFLCHSVNMLSKYLSVQLRYRLLCQSSRSAIQDDRAVIFPLFSSRTVDRDQLEHAFHLLDRNVVLLCRVREIAVAAKLHVLCKVKRVYESVIDGY